MSREVNSVSRLVILLLKVVVILSPVVRLSVVRDVMKLKRENPVKGEKTFRVW